MSGYPAVDPSALMALAVKGNEMRLHCNFEGVRMLADWFAWLSECPKGENWEIHLAWRLNANVASRGKQFTIVRSGPNLDRFFDHSEDTQEDEMTLMVVDSAELQTILDTQP